MLPAGSPDGRPARFLGIKGLIPFQEYRENKKKEMGASPGGESLGQLLGGIIGIPRNPKHPRIPGYPRHPRNPGTGRCRLGKLIGPAGCLHRPGQLDQSGHSDLRILGVLGSLGFLGLLGCLGFLGIP